MTAYTSMMMPIRGLTYSRLRALNKLFLDGVKCLTTSATNPHSLSLNISSRQLHTNDKIPSDQLSMENILSEENKLRVRQILEEKHFIRGLPRMDDGSSKVPRAGVLIPLCTVDGVPSVLFTLRSSQLNAHRGEVSFPGGKMEEGDENVTETALREAEEELGIRPDHADIWGTMQTGLLSKDGTLNVFGVLANLGELDVGKLKVDPNEVEDIFTSPIQSLCDNARYTRFLVLKQSVHRYPKAMRNLPSYTMPVYDRQKYRIWGITGMLLHFALKTCAPGLYNLKLK